MNQETITACENVCRDFAAWFPGFAAILADLGTFILGIGVIAAFLQLKSWRSQTISKRNAELGEDLIATAARISAEFETIRSPIGFGPPEGEDDDGTYDYLRRLDELSNLNDTFDHLKNLQIRQDAYIENEKVDSAVSNLFEARSQLIFGLRGMILVVRHGSQRGRRLTEEQLEKELARQDRYESRIWGALDDDGNEVDPVKELLNPAIETIRNEMIPYVRLAKD